MWYYPIYAPQWMFNLPEKQIRQLQRGEPLAIGDSIYAVCGDCHEVIKVNKFLFGDLHLCDGKK